MLGPIKCLVTFKAQSISSIHTYVNIISSALLEKLYIKPDFASCNFFLKDMLKKLHKKIGECVHASRWVQWHLLSYQFKQEQLPLAKSSVNSLYTLLYVISICPTGVTAFHTSILSNDFILSFYFLLKRTLRNLNRPKQI